MKRRLARRYYVSGQVQGVGYRNFAQRAARDLGVQGWARNLDDGRVEALAVGTGEQLENFEGQLRVGPAHARVQEVEVADAAEERVEGFHIR
jgi:acylphosphatase